MSKLRGEPSDTVMQCGTDSESRAASEPQSRAEIGRDQDVEGRSARRAGPSRAPSASTADSEYDSDPDDRKYVPAAEAEHDDMLYDPEADDDDEKWVLNQRRGHQSDGLLSCPCCFTTVCVDCQQHPSAANQFRALAVQNCTVVSAEGVTESDLLCEACGTVVGSYDHKEEVFYLVDVLCSEA